MELTEYRHHAGECLSRAENTNDPSSKLQWLALAGGANLFLESRVSGLLGEYILGIAILRPKTYEV